MKCRIRQLHRDKAVFTNDLYVGRSSLFFKQLEFDATSKNSGLCWFLSIHTYCCKKCAPVVGTSSCRPWCLLKTSQISTLVAGVGTQDLIGLSSDGVRYARSRHSSQSHWRVDTVRLGFPFELF